MDDKQIYLFGEELKPDIENNTVKEAGKPAPTPGTSKEKLEVSRFKVFTRQPADTPRLITSDKYAELESLDILRDRCLKCRECSLADARTNVVFGEGNPRARIMLVGEGPGKTEDETGRPFVGLAGQLLDKILASVGFQREEVFIANVVKCRPPGNRLPTPEESLACRPFLDAQIRLINPLIIVCLGALSTQALIEPKGRITALRGQWFKKENFWLIPTFHPAALLRDSSKKRPVWEDFKEIRRRYDSLVDS